MDKKINIIKIDHIAIVSNNTKDLNYFFEKILGINDKKTEIVEDEGVSVTKYNLGGTAIEILDLIKENPSIQRFIDKNNTSFHHISFLVDDIVDAIEYFKSKNIKVIYDPPKIGSCNQYISFLHPSDACGLLIEISQNIDA